MEFLSQFFSWFWKVIDLPAMLLVAVMGMLFYALYRVQVDPHNDFDFADMFRDEAGKPSASKLMILVCGGVTSWGIMYMLMHNDDSKIDPVYFGIYMGVWSGSALATKALDIWGGRGPSQSRNDEDREHERPANGDGDKDRR